MASRSEATFPGFLRLTNSISIPNTSSRAKSLTTSTSESPSLVIMCTWLFANPIHIAKYIQGYQSLCPDAQILVIQSSFLDVTFRSNAVQFKNLEPACTAINNFLTDHQDHKSHESYPSIHLHAFSNAGSHAAVQLVEAFQKSHGNSNSRTLPINPLILDSCPGQPSFTLAMHAMTHDLRRSPLPIKVAGIASIYLVMSVLVLLSIFGSENAIVKTRRVLNDPSGALLRAEIPRRYLYSQTDTMVPWKDVVSHAAEARKNLKADGNANIECIEFERSGHVAHMMVDKERYWRVIRETWERSANASKSWR